MQGLLLCEEPRAAILRVCASLVSGEHMEVDQDDLGCSLS